ncbi:Uncharacterized protein APZ42_007239, partial [Daphnia magna]
QRKSFHDWKNIELASLVDFDSSVKSVSAFDTSLVKDVDETIENFEMESWR